MNKFKEIDLYEPIKSYFIKKGYKIQAEVKNCDIVCLYEEKLIVIEMKKSFNLKLVYQAMDRKIFSDAVFIAIKRPKYFNKKEFNHMLSILKALDIGLITVALDSPLKRVDIIFEPNYKNLYKRSRKRDIILNEIQRRNLDLNIGGSTKKEEILTAYREQSIFLCCILKNFKKGKASDIKKIFNIENPSYILRNNHYGYFKRIERGIYSLSEKGEEMLKGERFKDVIKYYKKEVSNIVQHR